VLSIVVIHSAREGTKGAMTTTDHDDGNDKKAVHSDVGRVVTAAHSDKRQVRPPTDHVKRLLEEAYLNHAYPIRHKLIDCDMTKSFLISGSLT
jgi:hypothetical protein